MIKIDKRSKKYIKHQEFHQQTQHQDYLNEVQNQEINQKSTLEYSNSHYPTNNRYFKNNNKKQSSSKYLFLFTTLFSIILGIVFLVQITTNRLLEDQNRQTAKNIYEDWNKQKQSFFGGFQLFQSRIENLEEVVDQLNIRIKQINQQLNSHRSNLIGSQSFNKLQRQVREIQQQNNQAINSLSNPNQKFLQKLKQNLEELQISKKLLNDIQNNKNSASAKNNKPDTRQGIPQAPTKYRIRQHFRDFTPKSQPIVDRYEFTTSIQNVIDTSPMNSLLPNQNSQWEGLTKSTYQRAIKLMQVVHNINIKGQMLFDHFNFYSSAEEKYKAFSKILQEEYDYYDQKYQIGKYNKNQIGICISSPTFNSAQKSRLYLRNLDSVFQQQYDNYHIVVTNDASTDGTGEYLQKYMQVNNIPADKYTIINNQKNMGSSYNTYMAGHKHCKLGQIMIYLDGDDALIGRQVFSLLNAFYQRQKCALTYGQFFSVRQNFVCHGFSAPVPQKILQEGTFRKVRAFCTSHLKSMYVDVFRAIPQNHFQYHNGTWFDNVVDVVFMTPAIELTGTRSRFVNQFIYEYRYDSGAKQVGSQKSIVLTRIYNKSALKKLQDFSFADNPKTKSYN